MRLHRKWSRKRLEAVFALGEVTEFCQELVIWLHVHNEMLHQQDIVWVFPITDTALQQNMCNLWGWKHSSVNTLENNDPTQDTLGIFSLYPKLSNMVGKPGWIFEFENKSRNWKTQSGNRTRKFITNIPLIFTTYLPKTYPSPTQLLKLILLQNVTTKILFECVCTMIATNPAHH